MTDTNLNQLVINELTKAQYNALTPEQNQLYLVTDELPLENTATESHSVTISGTPASVDYSINIGSGSVVQYGSFSTVIGANASSSIVGGSNGIAIGYNAKVTQPYAIQIGNGTNSTAHSLSVALDSNKNYTLLNSDGTIPAERLTNASLSGLSDTAISSPTDGQVLKYNGTAWVNDTSPSGASALSDLTDTSISSPTSGQFLKYNGTAWANTTFNGLENTATGDNSLTILGTPTDTSQGLNIGKGSVADTYYTFSIGYNASATKNSGAMAIGHSSQSTGGIAIGYKAKSTNNDAIQIGTGTNSTAESLSVGFRGSGNNYLVLTSDGTIPAERLTNALPSQSGNTGKYLTTNGTTASWATVSASADPDNVTINTNSSSKLQAVGLIEKNSGTAKYDWVGTKAEYDALESYNSDWLYYITDDCTYTATLNTNRVTRGISSTPITTIFSMDTSTNTLTIKAGSKAHYPNGKDASSVLQVEDYKFTEDVTYSPTDLTAKEFIVYNITQSRFEHIPVSQTCTTSDGTTTLATCLAYNSSTNYIRKTTDTGSTWGTDVYTFPICIVTNTSGKILDVVQSFQGATYLGKTIYFEKEYKVRIPNGFYEDTGEPRFVETELTSNRLSTITGNYSLYLEIEENDPTTQYVSQCNNALVYMQEIMPTYRNVMIWYNPRTNYWYFTQDGGDTWSKCYLTYLTNVNQLADSNYIGYFNPRSTATTLTTDDMNLVTHWCYPSRWRTTITPTSGSMYTAPADGYFYLSVSRTSGTSDAYAMITGYETNYVTSSACPSVADTSSSTAAVIMPVSSGNTVIMNFSGTVNVCGFYYCNGGFIA